MSDRPTSPGRRWEPATASECHGTDSGRETAEVRGISTGCILWKVTKRLISFFPAKRPVQAFVSKALAVIMVSFRALRQGSGLDLTLCRPVGRRVVFRGHWYVGVMSGLKQVPYSCPLSWVKAVPQVSTSTWTPHTDFSPGCNWRPNSVSLMCLTSLSPLRIKFFPAYPLGCVCTSASQALGAPPDC